MPHVGYRELADRLRSAIETGVYAPGDTIPTLEQLMEQHSATSATVRRAVGVLRAEGLVTPVRRRGTVVRDRTRVTLRFARYAEVLEPAPAPAGSRGPWETACAEQGIPGRTDTVAVDQRPASAEIASALRITEGDPVVYRQRHMFAGPQVAQLSESHLPLSLVQGTQLADAEKVTGGVYRALGTIGHPPATTTEKVTARMPTPEEAEALSLDIGAPVMTIFRVTRDENGVPVEALYVTCAGDRVDLLYEDLPIRR